MKASPTPGEKSPTLVVGIGAAAGGQRALEAFFRNLPRTNDIAFVVITRLGNQNAAGVTEALDAAATLDVVPVTESLPLAPNRIYVGEAETFPCVRDGKLLPDTEDNGTATPMDRLFYSLSEEVSERAVGIVLSGAGTDGTLGLKAISDAGGMTMAQSPESAEYETMPRNAAALGLADHVLAPEAMPEKLLVYAENLVEISNGDGKPAFLDRIQRAIPDVAEILKQDTGHDFQHYKSATLSRRVQRRMQVLSVASVEEYLSRLREDREEIRALFRELLIGVTEFFRDPKAFEALSREVMPHLFENRMADEPVRIWVPGCATGEEAYSIAILLREEMEQRNQVPEVQIFGTDIDDRALEVARQGLYPVGITDNVSPQRLERFFVKRGQRYQVARKIRELCLFSHHNLISDPPYSRMDLISCRNLLIYLGPHLQQKLIPMFHYALRPGGYLFLGPCENIGAHHELFRTVDAGQHISQRKRVAPRAMTVLERTEPIKPAWPPGHEPEDSESEIAQIMRSVLVDEFLPHAVVVDGEGGVVCASDDMSKYLNVGSGVFQNDVVKLTQPGLRVGLRTAIAEASETKRRVVRDRVSLRVDGRLQPVMITVQPMPELGSDSELLLVVFEDVGLPLESTTAKSRRTDEDTSTLIDQLERELHSTRRDLESSVQDLEAANEELKSSNEELRSMNEELRSANEELETRKEEVQAAHAALERAHDDLQNLVFSTQIPLIILDDDLCIRTFTPAVTKIYNLIDSDVGRPLWHQTHRALAMPPLPEPSELGEDDGVPEDIVQTIEGRSYVRRVRRYRTREGRSDGMIVSFTDVTELTDSERRFRVLADNVPDIVFHADERLEWTYVNSRFFERMDTENAAGTGDGWLGCVHPDDEEKTREALTRAHQTGEPFQAEHRLRTRDGSYRWFVTRAVPLDAGNELPVEWFGTITDVHDLKQAQEALRRSEQQRRLALIAGRLGVYELDLDTNVITLDERAREILGVSKSSIPVKKAISRIHHDDRATVESVLKNEGRRVDDTRSWVEFRLTIADRGEVWLTATAQAQFEQTASGLRAVRLIGILQEITERKLQERELRMARAAAESASRAKSQFLANMSHEIRTPMTAILGYADVLAKHLKGSPEALEYLDTIRRNGRFLLEILNDVLDLSKIEADQLEVRKERFRPDSVVGEVRSLMEAQAIEKGIALLVDFDGDLPETVESDPNRLRQILLNLVSNAIKFTESGSVRLVVRVDRDMEKLEFDVIDTGVGIHPDQQQKLFEPFAQADDSPSRRFMGSGLGLTISQRLAHLLGGEIQVESEPGEGSTFRLTVKTGSLSGVPSVAPSAEVVSPDARDARLLPSLEGSVLVVDDRREVRALARHFLEEAGAKVATANDGQEAIDEVARAASAGEPFDLVLMDMQMPGMDGYEAVSRLRANGFDNPIIALTAHAMRGEREKCLAAGCDDYASKPIDSAELVAMITRYLRPSPRPGQPATTSSSLPEQEGVDPSSKYRILLVDDSQDLLEMKRILLESRGHEVRTAVSAKAALEAATDDDGFAPDVVILDLGLPDTSGHELLGELRELPSCREAVYLALSGRDDEADRKRSLEAGFYQHLVKPADVDELEAVAAEALGRAAGRKR